LDISKIEVVVKHGSEQLVVVDAGPSVDIVYRQPDGYRVFSLPDNLARLIGRAKQYEKNPSFPLFDRVSKELELTIRAWSATGQPPSENKLKCQAAIILGRFGLASGFGLDPEETVGAFQIVIDLRMVMNGLSAYFAQVALQQQQAAILNREMGGPGAFDLGKLNKKGP